MAWRLSFEEPPEAGFEEGHQRVDVLFLQFPDKLLAFDFDHCANAAGAGVIGR